MLPWQVCSLVPTLVLGHDHPLLSVSSELKTKRSDVTQQTDPNFFWPGHLLDKLQLYLPTLKRDRSLALFSSVCPQPPAYPVTYHRDRWWPIKNRKYVTYANYDDNKVYYID